MPSDIYWIEAPGARLGIMARPRGDDWLADEVENWQAAGVEVVVSLLEAAEEEELGLRREEALCRARAIEFLRLPIPDRSVPLDEQEAQALAEWLAACERPVAIHCRAGIGRSSLMAALVMLKRGFADPLAAFARIQAARGFPVPDTDDQRTWVVSAHHKS